MGYMACTENISSAAEVTPTIRTFAVEELDQQVGEASVGQIFSGDVAH
jgi:hypothetical protein